jgi:DNA-binding transcriptional LysR family regulator
MPRELLIQGGYVVTVDPELGDLPEGDVLVTDDVITAVSTGLQTATPDVEVIDARRRNAPIFRTVEEKLEHVAAGHGIVLLPLSTATFYTRPGVSYSHVSDITPNQVCLAWEATRRSRLIQDFAVTAADHLPVADRS